MNRAIILIFGALTVVTALDSRLEKADAYYEAEQTLEALSLCKEVLKDDSNDPEALWRMARLYCSFGDSKTAKPDKLARYENALGYAEKAKNAGSSSAEAWFWYGVSMGKVGQTRGITSSMSMAGPIKNAFLKTVALDSDHTSALFGLGMWYKEVPGIAGGDLDKSVTYFKKVLSLDSNYTEVYVRLAEIYMKKKEYETARSYLNKCLSITSPTYPDDYNSYDKPGAKELLDQLEE